MSEEENTMIVANFTPDPINWMHQGITGIIPGCKEGSEDNVVEMDDNLL